MYVSLWGDFPPEQGLADCREELRLAFSGKGVCAGNLKGSGSEYGCVNVDVRDEKYLELIPEWSLEIFRSIITFCMCLDSVIYLLYC